MPWMWAQGPLRWLLSLVPRIWAQGPPRCVLFLGCTLSLVPRILAPGPLRCALSQGPRVWARGLLHHHGSAEWVGCWSGCCWRISQTASECLHFFFFEKFLLLNPAVPYKEQPVLSHSPPLQLDQGLSRSDAVLAQLSTLPSWYTGSLWVYHFVLIPLPVTSSNQVSLGVAQALFGRGGSH